MPRRVKFSMLWAFPSDLGDASKIAQDIDSDDHALARVRKIAATGEANVLDAQTQCSEPTTALTHEIGGRSTH